jgi:prepilin-type N-terminal cleavage/methylation domain-containing protein
MKFEFKGKSGFTLIELMIVVAIIGVLATVAVPAFLRYMFDAREAEATRMLMDAYHDEIRVQNDCYSDRYTNCAPGPLKFTELVESGDASYPILIYRPAENSKFTLIAGNSDTVTFSKDAIPGAKYSTAPAIANFFGYRDIALHPEREKFMLGAEGLMGGKRHVLGMDEDGVLYRICDAWNGDNGPGAAVYHRYFTVDPKCSEGSGGGGSDECSGEDCGK